MTESSIVMQLLGGSLVAPLYGDISDAAMLQIQTDILDKVSSAEAKGLILDLTGIATIDSFIAESILETVKMASLLGATSIIVGLRADIVAALIQLKIDLHGLKTALNLDMAQELLKPFVTTEMENDDANHFAEDHS